jgi:hypothetical protein
MACAWKYDLSRRAETIKGNADFSIRGYLSSATCNALLVKYAGFYVLASSRIKAELTVEGDTTK